MVKFLYAITLVTGLVLLSECNIFKSGASRHVSRELKIARKRWPGTSQQDLDSGQALFVTRCAKCHAAKPVTIHTEEEWEKTLKIMAPKAKLNEYQTQLVTRFIYTSRIALME